MLESRVARYCLYGSCFIISSEIFYYTFYWLKRKLEQRSCSKEVCEVIWTNELTHSCASLHRYNNNGIGYASSNKASENVKKYCNPFCAAYNVGRLIDFIDSAKYSIDLAMYTFTSYELSQAFVRALNRGVLIRIVSDHEMAFSSGSQIIPLTKAGIPIRCNANTLFMHHKFCILDSPQRVTAIHKKQDKAPDKYQTRSILMTGSLNWTMQGFGGNWENILITSNMNFIRKYSEEFERMWNIFDVDFEKKNTK